MNREDIPDLRRKADSGSPVARSILGICYLYGIDVEVDYNQAFQLLSSAGTSRAVVNLARMYAEGLGVPRDTSEAIRLYKAVAKVEFHGQLALGRIYSRGDGVPADTAEAFKWYSAAAARDDQNCVGDTAAGALSGVPINDEIREAKEYVARATKNRDTE